MKANFDRREHRGNSRGGANNKIRFNPHDITGIEETGEHRVQETPSQRSIYTLAEVMEVPTGQHINKGCNFSHNRKIIVCKLKVLVCKQNDQTLP